MLLQEHVLHDSARRTWRIKDYFDFRHHTEYDDYILIQIIRQYDISIAPFGLIATV